MKVIDILLDSLRKAMNFVEFEPLHKTERNASIMSALVFVVM